ncbi:hypothetical protein MKY14_30340 [Paenibacillus sp. FSL R5-0887]|jgi:hypothetical protein|uniref:SMODS and SLOG-associating 2TM effector domain-containing protein n=1 Tax=Paenibacillus odorifer TaxID=189426 RepID=A0ABX3GFC0_9BACL|nr:hypothetical protein [Paenibacillus odorifer]OMC63140.1 hypothetical protein BK121_28710 [Paenibacillus odorifer]OMC97737.1 hypothetical protein BSO21_33285 [Paenibacillus odorifer]OMD60683.1 hypothetical protein BSK62_25325 [Paenibacillus odorifer]OMD67365.1 hypothetical protein BSK48_19895 [Paenibacillus odorifer]OMD82818.1 hypothetical protein BSK49_25175 [Paenibacillus odorifer]
MNENNQFIKESSLEELLNIERAEARNQQVMAGVGSPEVRATETNYISKTQLVDMINSHVGSSYTGLGLAVTSVGIGLATNAIKAKLPPFIAGALVAAATLITVGQLIQQVDSYTPANQLKEILNTLLNDYKNFTRIKVTVTTWQKLIVNPTMSYWTYYTTTEYTAVA